MSWDIVWQIVRYLLIAGGAFMTGKGWISEDQVTSIISAIGTIGAVLWGLFVKAGTTAVPNAIAARSDVPTVSGATGAVKTGPGL